MSSLEEEVNINSGMPITRARDKAPRAKKKIAYSINVKTWIQISRTFWCFDRQHYQNQVGGGSDGDT